MTRTDVITVLKILKVAYPTFYSRMRREDADDTVAVWCEMFRDENVDVVKLALYQVIAEHDNFPPSIGEIKTKIRELVAAATGTHTDEELWQTLKTAVGNGLYGAREEYAALPDEVRRYLGSPNTLRELAQTDTETLNTVVHGQFLRQIGAIRERVKFDRETPEEMKRLIAAAYSPMPDTRLLTEDEANTRRNALLDALDVKPVQKRRG